MSANDKYSHDPQLARLAERLKDHPDRDVLLHHRYRSLHEDFVTVESDLRKCALLIGHHYNSCRPVSDALEKYIEALKARGESPSNGTEEGGE